MFVQTRRVQTAVRLTLGGFLSQLLVLLVVEEIADRPESLVLSAVLVVLLERLVLADHLDRLLHVHHELGVDGVLGVDKAVGAQLPVHLLEVRKQLLLVDALSRRKQAVCSHDMLMFAATLFISFTQSL